LGIIILYYMRRIETLIFLCLCFAVCSAKKEVDTLYIRFFSWEDYKQPHIITCNNFEYELPYTEYCITDQSAINKLLDTMKRLSKKSDTDFCVGCKMFFVHDNKVVKTACLNSKYILIDGQTYSCTEDLVSTTNDMMRNGVLIDTQKKYLCGKNGDEFIRGREVLLSKLKTYLNRNIPKEIKKLGDIRIVIHCQSDKKGKTTRVEPHVYNNKLSEFQKKNIECLIAKFFLSKVKWKPDETRMKSDWIDIMYKYEVER